MTYSTLGLDTTTGEKVTLAKNLTWNLYYRQYRYRQESTFAQFDSSQDIRQNIGVTLIDAHGDLARGVLASLPSERLNDVIYLSLENIATPFGLNFFAV